MTSIDYERQKLYVVCVHNLTERRQAQARLNQLHTDRLLAMGGMATALAHEINQPLAACVAYLKVAQRLASRPAEQRRQGVEEALEKASDQILRAGKIIRHMREFVSRSEPDKTTLGLHALIRSACELTHASAKQGGVEVILDLSAGDDRILADDVQLKQVIVNLKRNAIEAMRGARRRQLTISTTLTEDGMIRTDIADTGVGLSEEQRADLFEPFRTTKARGLGVGLSLSRSIVQAHYGDIWAEPRPSGGMVFSFTLPLAQALAGESALSASL
jgi:C4-dicarboxylate-specific signal transduction histidine kinase